MGLRLRKFFARRSHATPQGRQERATVFTATEAGRTIAAAKEPFATLWAIVFMLGLRIGDGIALRVSDLDFERKIIRVRQSVDSVTRKVKACKSDASSADLPMPSQLEARLHTYLTSGHFRRNDAGLLFVNKRSRPHSANKLRVKQLHPLLERLGIPHGGFHGRKARGDKFHAGRRRACKCCAETDAAL
jgi:integrase